jgi:hypothetical protein
MFKFNRGGIDYEIKLVGLGDDDMLACEYYESGVRKFRSLLDTFDLDETFKGDEVAFLEYFLKNLNSSLDKVHGTNGNSSDLSIERLKDLVANGLHFDGEHVEIK